MHNDVLHQPAPKGIKLGNKKEKKMSKGFMSNFDSLAAEGGRKFQGNRSSIMLMQYAMSKHVERDGDRGTQQQVNARNSHVKEQIGIVKSEFSVLAGKVANEILMDPDSYNQNRFLDASNISGDLSALTDGDLESFKAVVRRIQADIQKEEAKRQTKNKAGGESERV